MAVREGFEPSVPFKGYNALAKRRFRPLSHLTGSRGGIYADNLLAVKAKYYFREGRNLGTKIGLISYVT